MAIDFHHFVRDQNLENGPTVDIGVYELAHMLHFTFCIFYFAPEVKGVLPTQDPGLGRGTQVQGRALGPRAPRMLRPIVEFANQR